MIEITNQKRNYVAKVPTSVKEINISDLEKLVANVEVAKYYAIIALCQTIAPSQLALAATRPDKDVVTSVTPILIKLGEQDDNFIGNVGDRVITTRSSLEMSTHLSVPGVISMKNLMALIEDNPTNRTSFTKGLVDTNGKDVNSIVGVEFKILPVNAIHACIKKDVAFTDPFKTIISGS